MSTKKFIVLDVEGLSNRRPYNIGYVVADRTGKIFEKVSVALPAVLWENVNGLSCLNAMEMTHKNIQEILADFENEDRKYTYQTIKGFYNELFNHIAKYSIKTIWAYNVAFDRASLKRLDENRFNQLNVEFADIWTAITYSKLCTKKYVKWCKDNEAYTPKGYLSTSAETVYKYLKGLTDFEEEHTGLADVMIELEILLYVFKSGKKVHKETSQPWRILRNLMQGKNWEF